MFTLRVEETWRAADATDAADAADAAAAAAAAAARGFSPLICDAVTRGVTGGNQRQLAVGVSGGISVLIHGIRLILEARRTFVCVRLST